MTTTTLAVLLRLVVVAIALGFGAIATKRMAFAARVHIPDDVCVSCGSTSLSIVAKGAYTCRECGYDGGSGRAELAEAATRNRYAALSEEQRRVAAQERLQEAVWLLTSLPTPSGERSDEPSTSQSQAVSQVHRATAALREAALITGVPIRLPSGGAANLEEEIRALDGIDDEDPPANLVQIRKRSAQVAARISRHLEGRLNSTELPIETLAEEDPMAALRDAAEAKRRLFERMNDIAP